MKDWFLRQTPRDRVIVIVVAAFVLLGLAYAILWYPLQQRHSSVTGGLESRRESLAFLQEGAAKLTAAGGPKQASSATNNSDKEPYLLIDEIIRKNQVQAPERLEPSGNNGARVQFSDVPFDKLVVILAELETYGLKITTMTVSRRDTGLVSVRFNMERG